MPNTVLKTNLHNQLIWQLCCQTPTEVIDMLDDHNLRRGGGGGGGGGRGAGGGSD